MRPRYEKLAPLLLPAAALLAFWPALHNGFVNWDDDLYILRNPLVQQLSWGNLKTIFFGFYAHYYAPLTFFSYALEHALAGADPWLYHLDNILLHALNSWLAYRFLLALGGRSKTALFGALLFAVHPLRVESVAWVTERKDLLYSCFYLLSMNAYLRYAGEKPGRRLLALSLLAFALSLLSKPMAVTLPAVLFVLDAYKQRPFSARLILEKIPYAALAAVAAWLTWLAQGNDRTGSGHLLSNLETALSNVYFYLGKMALPTGLSPLYPPATYATQLRHPPLFYAQTALALAVLYLCWKARRKFPELLFACLFFLLTASPVLQIVPVGWSAAADRYAYIPSLGIFFAAALLWEKLLDTLPRAGKRAWALCAALLVLGLGTASWRACAVWRDSVSLWSRVLTLYPDSGIALNNRGKAYIERDDFTSAEADFDRAVSIHPQSVIFLSNRASARARLGKFDMALDDLSKAIALVPHAPSAYNNRGATYLLCGKTQSAIKDFEKALELQPAYPDAAKNLAYARGLLLSVKKSGRK